VLKHQKQAAPFRPAKGCVLVFEHINYEGNWASFCGNVANLIPLGFNDLISSIKVPSDVKAVLYADVNYGGRTIEFTADEPNFVNKNYNDIASSIKLFLYPVVIVLPKPHVDPVVITPKPADPKPRRPSPGCVRLFEHVNYAGKSVELCYSNSDFTKINFNDIASSVWIGTSTKVALYEHVAYGGRVYRFTKDEPNFTKFGWLNDSISSAKVYSMEKKCENLSIERSQAPPTPSGAVTYSFGGRFKNALTGAFITAIPAGANVIAIGKGGFRQQAKWVGGRFVFAGLPEGKFEFEVSAKGWIGFKVVRTVTKVAAALSGNWDFTLSPALLLNQWRVVLTWGASPKDLDIIAVIRAPDQKDEKVYWKHRKSKNGLVKLDVDNTKGFGPETITFTNDLTDDTTLLFYVNNYSKTPFLNKSNAKVAIYNYDHEVATFTVPTNGNQAYWHVFNFTNKGLVHKVDKLVTNTRK